MTDLTPKGVRETLCRAAPALTQTYGHASHVAHDIDRISALIREIDKHRPFGADGKHRDLHTDTCGCCGHRRPWTITLCPDDPDED